MKKVKIGKKMIPAEDILEIKIAVVSDEMVREIRYREFEPCYAEYSVIVPFDKGYEIEKIVRKEMEKANRRLG